MLLGVCWNKREKQFGQKNGFFQENEYSANQKKIFTIDNTSKREKRKNENKRRKLR